MGLDLHSWLTYNGMTLEIVVWSIFAGIVLGAMAIYYFKNILGIFVRALLDNGALSPETARSLADCGCQKSRNTRLALRVSTSYRRLISARPADPDAETTYIDAKGRRRKRKFRLDELKFYIPAENRDKAESLYDNDGSGVKILFLVVVLSLLTAVLALKVVPQLIQMGSNLLERLSAS